MAAKASEKKSGAKSEVNSWLGEAFREEWDHRLKMDKQRKPFVPKPAKRAAKPKRR